MQVEVSMKDEKKAERRYQEYLKKMNKKQGKELAVKKIKTIERDKRTIKTG